MYYAYDFDFITRDGYGYRVANTLDWVPETPLTSQTATDFNRINPFKLRNEALKYNKIGFIFSYFNYSIREYLFNPHFISNGIITLDGMDFLHNIHL